MAKRSDFAQKLLDDLRLRKERLAASSQSSSRTNRTVAASDAYALAKRDHRGSRELRTTETTGIRTGARQSRSNGGNKPFTTGEGAKQIVPFGRGQSSEQIGDLSRALASAMENGCKLTRMDSTGSTTMLAFLNQLGRGSVDSAKMERRNMIDRHRPSTSNFPTLSNVHIEQISRGAQKLNQILRACSNGLNFDGYSIEIGKELLKGAVDLEESLRMLVNLQEASECMISPRRKSRITLLDEDEDEDEDDNTGKISGQRQLDRPRFSFDKRSGNYRDIEEVARNDLKMRLSALTYPPETINFIYEKQPATHKRSASTSSQSKGEKARIPNVIAKLMGLEELPEHEDSEYTRQKDFGSKQKVQEKNERQTVQGSRKNAKKRTDGTENPAPPTSKQKVSQTNKILAVQNDVALQAERDQAVRNDRFMVPIQDGKLFWKESENIKPVTGSGKASFKAKLQGNTNQLNCTIGGLKDTQEKHRELKGAEMSRVKEPVLKDELQRMAQQHPHKRSEAAVMSPVENNYPNKLLSVTQNKHQNNIGLQQPYKLRNIEPKEEKHRGVEQNAKHKMPIRKQKGSEPISTALSKPKHHENDFEKKQSHRSQAAASKKSLPEDVGAMRSERIPVGRPHEDIVSDRNTTNIKASASRNSNTSPRDLETKLAKPKAAMPPTMEKKPVHEPDTWKAESIKLQKRELPRKINEVMIKRGGNLQISGKSMKHQHYILHEMKHRSDKISVPREANHVRISNHKETEASLIASIRPQNAAQLLQKEDEHIPNLYSPVEEDSHCLKEPRTLSPYGTCPQVIPTLTNDQRGDQPVSDDVQLKSHISESNSLDGAHGDITYIAHTSQLKRQKASKSETPLLLTESENHLKKILIKSQVFLHTAEALFKLNIPYGILHAGGGGLDCCVDEHSKLVLDCGYELMKRKGRIQELSVHPFIKVSTITATTKVRSLDELVKELHKDIDELRLHGRNNGNAEVVVIEDYYLPKMLECDVYGKKPDVNCMWDLSWSEMMFAFIEKDDVIRDVERCVLNGLVDEITRDLYEVQIQSILIRFR